MPRSLHYGKEDIAMFIKNSDIRTVIDIGAGAGLYSDLLKEHKVKLKRFDAVEIFEEYVDLYKLKKKYDNVYVSDVRQWFDWKYDLAIFGDVLEHMSMEDARMVWEMARSHSGTLIAVIPIGHCIQDSKYFEDGKEYDNPYQEHVVDNYSVEQVLNNFPGIYKYSIYNIDKKDIQYEDDNFSIGIFYAKL